MKPITIVIASLVVVAVVGAGIHAYTTRKSDPNRDTLEMLNNIQEVTVAPSVAPTSAKMAPSTSSEFSGKLTDLFTRSESQKCTLISMPGTFYISSGRVRGEAITMQSMTVDIIIKDNTMYFWTKTPAPYGFKVSMAGLQAPASSPAAGSGAVNQYEDVLTKDQKFTCTAWNLDESKFTLPTDITFASISH